LLAAVTATIFGMLLLVIAMLDDRAIHVTFDPARGYLGTHHNLPQPVIALSLSELRARVSRQLGLGANSVRLKLDRAARPAAPRR
jgi:hypothetical protein